MSSSHLEKAYFEDPDAFSSLLYSQGFRTYNPLGTVIETTDQSARVHRFIIARIRIDVSNQLIFLLRSLDDGSVIECTAETAYTLEYEVSEQVADVYSIVEKSGETSILQLPTEIINA